MAYKTTEEYRLQGGRGEFVVSGDFPDTQNRVRSSSVVRDVVFRPNDGRLPDLAICRVYSSREDADKIAKAMSA